MYARCRRPKQARVQERPSNKIIATKIRHPMPMFFASELPVVAAGAG
jgi:hypothetical protein